VHSFFFVTIIYPPDVQYQNNATLSFFCYREFTPAMRGSKYNFIPSSIARTYCFPQKHYIMTTLLHEFTEIEMSDRMESRGRSKGDDSERERLPPPVGIPRAPTSNIMFAHMPIQNQKPRALQYIFSRELGRTISEGLPCVVGVSIYTREHAYGNHTVPRKISFYYFCWFSLQVGPNSSPAPSGVLLASSPYLAVNRRLSPAAG
jgi:hypothetical protein